MPGLDYESAKGWLQDPDPRMRHRLASHSDTPAEILYYLSKDPSPEVRRAVAANHATPRHADVILAQDPDHGVRIEVARKIGGSGLNESQRGQLWRVGFTILETLACDRIVRVRQIVAHSIKSLVNAPFAIVFGMARDPEPDVAVPILENSPVLKDQHLIEIIQYDSPEWAKEAIARRGSVPPSVSDAIAADGSVLAVSALLANHGAEIGETTMESIVDRAPKVKAWHAPLVVRPRLSDSILVRLSRFVAGPLLKRLRGRKDLSPETASTIDRVTEARLQLSKRKKARKAGDQLIWMTGGDNSKTKSWERPEDRVGRLKGLGKLTDEAVTAALRSGDLDFVVAALAARAEIPSMRAHRILGSKNAAAVTALCWKAGFMMWFATEIQRRVAGVPPEGLLTAADGRSYPLSEKEMRRLLQAFEGKGRGATR